MRIINDVLRIIETKKVNAKNADIEEGACDRQRHKGSSVRLSRSGRTCSAIRAPFRARLFCFAVLGSCLRR